MSKDSVVEIRAVLRDVGAVSLSGPDGKTLYLVLNRNIGVKEQGVLIALDGMGAMFFNLDRPLNKFRLVQHGFSMRIAQALADLVNAILTIDDTSAEFISILPPSNPS